MNNISSEEKGQCYGQCSTCKRQDNVSFQNALKYMRILKMHIKQLES